MSIWLIAWLSQIVGVPEGSATSAHHVVWRSVAAAAAMATVCWVGGPAAIGWLARRFREPLKSGSARLDGLHRAKESTPTMGGILLIAGIAITTLLLANPANGAVIVALAVALGMALVGGLDDLMKLRSPSKGLGWKAKLAAQTCVAVLPALTLGYGWGGGQEHSLWLPGGMRVTLGSLAAPWVMLLVVGTSNAVNFTDGLDGLAAGCLLIATAALAAVSCLCTEGDAQELVVLAGAMIGALLGFLPYNRHPARVFMGNVGSLSLGGLLAVLAIGTGLDLLLPLAGGIFVAEAASVIVQIGWFKRTGRRVFRCAPLHHHFEFAGWPEERIVARFWMVSAACALAAIVLALSTPLRGGLSGWQPPPVAAARGTLTRQ